MKKEAFLDAIEQLSAVSNTIDESSFGLTPTLHERAEGVLNHLNDVEQELRDLYISISLEERHQLPQSS